VDDARAQLRRHLAEYDSAREQVFLVDQRRKPDELKAGLGPLPLDLLERARSEAQLAEGTPVR
jgi:hypothetical protein